jgi:hypothetical protein
MVEPVASAIRAKGDKNKMAVSASALRSADYGGRPTPSDQCAWGVFVYTKTHLAFEKITRFYELLHPCILG